MLATKTADIFFKKLAGLEQGTLELATPDGKTRVFGGHSAGPAAKLELRDWRVLGNLAISGDIGFAEDYRAKLWDTDNLQDLLSLALMNEKAVDAFIFGILPARVLARLGNLLRGNTLKGSRRNIRAHYDLGNDFYALWLDRSMTYSSGIFATGSEGLEDAQRAKYGRIVDHLGSSSGSLLEIGCGWGGFAEYAQSRGDFAIKGLTLSDKQKRYAAARLGDSAQIALEDYRTQTGTYDNIVSIEMFEAVGQEYWKTYFDKVAASLKRDGRAMIQTITIEESRFERYKASGDFIRKHIFPGGLLPSRERFSASALQSGLQTKSVFEFGHDYARTLEKWLANFDARKADVMALGYDEGFIRMWRFYLAGCIAGFRTNRVGVMQAELIHV